MDDLTLNTPSKREPPTMPIRKVMKSEQCLLGIMVLSVITCRRGQCMRSQNYHNLDKQR